MTTSTPVYGITIFAGKDTTATAPGLLTPTGGGGPGGGRLLTDADIDLSQAVTLLQVINLANGNDDSAHFILASSPKAASTPGFNTPQVMQVQGVNLSANMYIATFGFNGPNT